MARTSLLALVLCLALASAVVPVAAKADPRVLTTSELALVTAGRASLLPAQINRTAQTARATAVSTAICSACTNATVTASSSATAFNVNLAELTNLSF